MKLNNKADLKLLREGIEENLAEFAREHGITIKTGNISFEGHGCGCKVQLVVETGDKDKADWEQHCGLFDLNPGDFGKTFMWANREQVEIVGIRPKALRGFRQAIANEVADEIASPKPNRKEAND